MATRVVITNFGQEFQDSVATKSLILCFHSDNLAGSVKIYIDHVQV